MRVPAEGNYKVTVKLGDKDRDSVTTVKAELRRLMLERVRTKAGKFETRTFIVNVRTPRFRGGEVRLKDREKTSEAWAWDDKLTLEFTDAQSRGRSQWRWKRWISCLPLYRGRFHVHRPAARTFNSWGQMITRFFKPEIAVANHGESGESLQGFLGEGRLDKVMSVIQPGDYLFIQMGHNDQKEKGEGVGAFTTYKADLKRFIAAAREHGATPVVITPVNRMSFEAGTGKIVSSLGDYPEAVRQTAQEENVALIDLNAMSKPFYEALGPEQAHVAFAGNDKTHHSAITAATNWRSVWWKGLRRRDCRWRNIWWTCRSSIRRIRIPSSDSIYQPSPRVRPSSLTGTDYENVAACSVCRGVLRAAARAGDLGGGRFDGEQSESPWLGGSVRRLLRCRQG